MYFHFYPNRIECGIKFHRSHLTSVDVKSTESLQIKVSYFILRGFGKVQRDSFNDIFVTNVNLLVDCIIVANLLL
ncbi:unnamed protein product [Rotaria magnacalcarata]